MLITKMLSCFWTDFFQGYPMIKYFPVGPKGFPEDFNGGRTTGDIVNWAMEKYSENISPPKVISVIFGIFEIVVCVQNWVLVCF
jgi:hypothetical protein